MRKLIFIFLILNFCQFSFAKELTLKKLTLRGSNIFSEQKILEKIDFKKNKKFSEKNIEQWIDKIIKLYEEEGYPFCQITPSEFNKENDEIAVSLNITEGPEVRIRNIYLDGLNKTRPFVLYREMGIDSIDVFSQKKIESALQRIKKKSFIEDAKENIEIEKDPNWADLRLEIKEKKSNSFEGIFGYVPSSDRNKAFFTGKFILILDNILGTARKGELKYSRKDAYSSDISLFYQEPWVLNFPFNLNLSLRQIDYDTSYLYSSIGSEIEFPLSEKLSWSAKGSWEKTVPQEKGKKIIPSSRKYSFILGANLEVLDYFENPRKGIFYKTNITYSRKRNYPTPELILEKEVVYETRFSLQLAHFIPTLKRQTMVIGLNTAGIISDEKVIPLSEQFKMGGLNTLRGYREEEFSGDKIFWTNLEYRFLVSQFSRVFLFFDWGYFSKNIKTALGEIEKIERNRLGYGFGLNLKSKIGFFALNFGWGKEDKFSDGKVHFGISNRF